MTSLMAVKKIVLQMESCKIVTQGIKLVTKPMDPRNGKSLAVRMST